MTFFRYRLISGKFFEPRIIGHRTGVNGRQEIGSTSGILRHDSNYGQRSIVVLHQRRSFIVYAGTSGIHIGCIIQQQSSLLLNETIFLNIFFDYRLQHRSCKPDSIDPHRNLYNLIRMKLEWNVTWPLLNRLPVTGNFLKIKTKNR